MTTTPHPTPNPTHKGWYSRGYLPHFDAGTMIQSVTFRLADSLPTDVLLAWVEALRHAEPHQQAAQRRRIEQHLDAGYGACHLRDPRIAHVVQQALLHFDGQRYRLIAWVVMPNHLHSVIETREGFPLYDIVRSWKSFTALQANKLLGRQGAFWQADYFDRFIRDEAHLMRVIAYIHENPVKAGLVEWAEEWVWSSAYGGGEQERTGGPEARSPRECP